MFRTFQSLRIRRLFWFLTIFDRLVKISPGSGQNQAPSPWPLSYSHFEEVMNFFGQKVTLFRSKLAQNRPKRGQNVQKVRTVYSHPPNFDWPYLSQNFWKGGKWPQFYAFQIELSCLCAILFENLKDFPKNFGQSQPKTFSLFGNRLTLTNFFSDTRFSKSDENARKMRSSFR